MFLHLSCPSLSEGPWLPNFANLNYPICLLHLSLGDCSPSLVPTILSLYCFQISITTTKLCHPIFPPKWHSRLISWEASMTRGDFVPYPARCCHLYLCAVLPPIPVYSVAMSSIKGQCTLHWPAALTLSCTLSLGVTPCCKSMKNLNVYVLGTVLSE